MLPVSPTKTDGSRLALIPMIIGVTLFGLFAAHIALFLFGAQAGLAELGIIESTEEKALYGVLQAAWSGLAGSAIETQRVFPAVLACVAFWVLVMAVLQRTGEAVVSAVLPLGMIVFPAAVYEFATVGSASLAVLLSLLGVMAATRDHEPHWVNGVGLGAVIGVLPFVDGAGAALGAGLVVLALFESRPPLFWGALSVTVFVLVGLFSQMFAFAPQVLAEPHQAIGGLREYAMLWVALAVSALALAMSTKLRSMIGPLVVRRGAAALSAVGISIIWLGLSAMTVGLDLSRVLPALLGLALIAAAPFALWIRLVMPAIRSMWIWILMPVLMYSCFWLVLSGIDLSAHPYSELKL